jgi:hypothetical protein
VINCQKEEAKMSEQQKESKTIFDDLAVKFITKAE